MKEKMSVKKEITLRAWLVYAAFLLFGVAILLKILYIQYGPESAERRKTGEGPRTFRTDLIEAGRGDIFSHDGNLLATTVPTYDLKMDFRATGLTDSLFERNVDSLSIMMSRFFGDKSAAGYKSMLRDYRRRAKTGNQRVFRIAPRRVSYLQLAEVKKFPLLRIKNVYTSGFIPEKIADRKLLYGSIAQRTIGRRVNDTEKWGIEGSFDNFLRGEDGQTKSQRISGTFWMPIADDSNREPVNGMDVVSTIDIELQDVAERALREQLQFEGADWGTAVLMEVATGEIRAIANLTRRSNGDCVEDLNHAIAQRINPGSTFKLPVLMVLLDDAGMSLDDIIDVEGGDVTLYRKRVRDSHLGYRELTLREVFEVSSNVGFAKAVNEHYRHDQQRFVDQLVKMGINDTIPFQLAGYKGPYIHTDSKKWSMLTLTSMAYGYELEMSPIQTLTIYNAVANGGRMISPIIVKELKQYGQTVRTYRARTLRERICSPSTLKMVQETLKGVATDGTAKGLRIQDLPIAVKTGTAQIPNNNRGYGTGGGMDYLATIVGYFPADNPKYSCIVSIKTFTGNGRGANYYGGSLAGPVFKAIAERVYGSSVDWQEPISASRDRVGDYPAVKNGDVRDVKEVLGELSIPYGSKWNIRGQVEMQVDSTGARLENIVTSPDTMPDVRGYGLRDALRELESRGLTVSFSGKGRVVRQSIARNTAIRRGQQVHITLN